MKTKLLIIICILFPLFAFSQTKPEDFKWEGKRNYRNDFDVSYIKDQYNTLYYLMDNYVMIKSNFKNNKASKVEFENGEVKKISDSLYCIVPNKIGSYHLTINGESETYKVIELPEDKIDIKFSASTSPFPDCISRDEFLKSKEIIASFNHKRFKFRHWAMNWRSDNSDNSGGTSGNSDTIDVSITKYLKNVLKISSEIGLDMMRIYIYDTLNYLKPIHFKVVDNYQNEYIRRTLLLSNQTNDFNLLKNDLRIKISGCLHKEFLEVISEIANELNGMLQTIQIKIVEKQPSLTIIMDTISYHTDGMQKRDSLYIANGYKHIYSGGYLKEIKNEFFPFNRRFLMYFEYMCNCDNTKSDTVHLKHYVKAILKKNIIGLLTNFSSNNIYRSFFNKDAWDDDLTVYDKSFLKTLYSKGGEEKIKKILNKDYSPQGEKSNLILILVLSICLLFVFSEIYTFYNISNLIGKIRYKIVKRIIESVLFAQIILLAYLIIQLINFGNVGQIREVLSMDMKLSIFAILSGILLLYLDQLLEKIKMLWLNTILNLTLSFFSIAVAYQIMYFFITPEFIKLSVIGWEILLIPLLITLYRLYSRFQTNKIAGLLQEKELELSKQKELKFKSDLNALQARINPHFLYNALNSLASLAHIDSGRTEKMALSLSKLFRYNINKKEEHYATLQEEIEMADIYLDIEKNRFEDKLTYRIELQEQLNDFKIPKFILQPLAENAVKHGVSKMVDKGIIRINIFEQAQKVVIEIYDNGPDFPTGLISGYGLQNTYEKLKLLYKKPFDIAFINTPEKKLVITLTK